MATFRVLAGKHTQPDWNAPEPVPDPRTGIAPKRPSNTYKRGEVFESPFDEVARLGHEKVEYLGGPYEPAPGSPRREYAHPGGQVLQGVQATTQGPDGQAFTGPEGAVAAQAADPAVEAGRQAQARQNAAAFKAQAGPAKATRVIPTVAQLEAMPVEDLRAYAADEGVAVAATANKGDLIKAIRAK